MDKADEPDKNKHSVKMKMFLLSQIEYSKYYLQPEQCIIRIILQRLPHGTTAALNISAIKKGVTWCHAQIHVSTLLVISSRTK